MEYFKSFNLNYLGGGSALSTNIDGTGNYNINTGLKYLDHLLEQFSKHGSFDLYLTCLGDLEIDEHHTIEDTALALGEAFKKALGNKIGIERYGYSLPMDDCLCQVALDFGGRPWIVWEAEFKREMIGEMPTEMFFHFFKSFSDSAKIFLLFSCLISPHFFNNSSRFPNSFIS